MARYGGRFRSYSAREPLRTIRRVSSFDDPQRVRRHHIFAEITGTTGADIGHPSLSPTDLVSARDDLRRTRPRIDLALNTSGEGRSSRRAQRVREPLTTILVDVAPRLARGGVTRRHERRAVRGRCRVLACTPDRLIDAITDLTDVRATAQLRNTRNGRLGDTELVVVANVAAVRAAGRRRGALGRSGATVDRDGALVETRQDVGAIRHIRRRIGDRRASIAAVERRAVTLGPAFSAPVVAAAGRRRSTGRREGRTVLRTAHGREHEDELAAERQPEDQEPATRTGAHPYELIATHPRAVCRSCGRERMLLVANLEHQAPHTSLRPASDAARHARRFARLPARRSTS